MDFKIFTIVAHVDHGKSTLADRIIEITSGQLPNFKKKQYLDELKVEQKRQITIKLSAVQLRYQPRIDRPMVTLQLIDTPGHYDFTAEVIRSFSICQIAIVLIDCSQGIEAQTIQHLN